jgi:ribbon-helix-helix protein
VKKRCTFMIEPDILERLQSIAARTGLSQSEQIRQGIRWWLESREWPIRKTPGEESPGAAVAAVPARRGMRRRAARRT